MILKQGFSRWDLQTNESKPEAHAGFSHFRRTAEVRRYVRRTSGILRILQQADLWETIAPLLDRASPLRTSHLRDPVGPQLHFASGSFIDEIAAAIGADPVEFRLRYLRIRAISQR